MDPWQEWLGRSRTEHTVLDPQQCDRMLATLDRDPGLVVGDVLPPAWHWLYFHEVVAASALGPDGHPRPGLHLPPVGPARRMWAGGRLRLLGDLLLGERAERVSTISTITPKTGRSGPLVLVGLEHVLRQRGSVRLVEQQTLVYRRPPPAGRVATPPGPPTSTPAAHVSARWQLDRTALFRYSALTFNGHRIHYDADYCRQVEGYPDVIVHGPLLATLLLDLLVRERRPLTTFDYRAVTPLFVDEAFTVEAHRDGEATDVWARGPHGAVVMQGRAE